MTIKIAISGTSRSGKTTAVKEIGSNLIAANYDVAIVREVAADCPYPLASMDGQRWIMHEQYIKELVAASDIPQLILCDRSVIDNAAYMRDVAVNIGLPDAEDEIGEVGIAVMHARLWIPTYDRVYVASFNRSYAEPGDNIPAIKTMSKVIKSAYEVLGADVFEVDLGYDNAKIYDEIVKMLGDDNEI